MLAHRHAAIKLQSYDSCIFYDPIILLTIYSTGVRPFVFQKPSIRKFIPAFFVTKQNSSVLIFIVLLLTYNRMHRYYMFISMNFDICIYPHTVLAAQSCPTLCDPVDCNLPGSSVHGIFQARIMSGLPFPSPGNLPNPGIKPVSPALQADSFPSEPPATREAHTPT